MIGINLIITLGHDFYRGAASTLRTRMKKKILDPVNWYKPKESTEEEKKDRKTARNQGEKPAVRKGKRKIETENEEGRKRIKKDEPKSG